MQTRLRYCRRMIFPKTLIGEIMVQLLLSRIRVHVDHVGVSAQLGPWKVLTSSLQENLSALANSSLWIAIMSVIQKNQARDSGCNSGLMNSAFEYILKSGGVMREDDYPYAGTDRGTCKLDKTKIAASVANFSVVSLDEDHIAANLVKNGPLAASINAVYMQTYVGGVSCPYICSRRLDDGVLLMGFGSTGYAPIRLKEKPYWIIKNSWGENWGGNGYCKICRGRNICGVDSMVSTVAAVHTTSQ